VKLVLIFGVIVAVGSLLVAGPILAGRLIDRGRRAYAILLLLPPLATFGMGVGNVGGGCLSIFLFGFDIDGKAPWWDRHLPAAGTATGFLLGAVIALFVCYRAGRTGGHDLRELAADYDDGGRQPMPTADNSTDAGR
jgi:hypothetical protein